MDEKWKEAEDALLERIRVLVRKEAKLDECVAAMIEFVERVDRGVVRSTYTYNKFEEILVGMEQLNKDRPKCCGDEAGVFVTDPMNGKQHSVRCIKAEIDFLIRCPMDEVHKASGLTIKERIKQLQRLIQ